MKSTDISNELIDYSDKDNSKLDKKYRLSMLYDFYGELLKEHHRQIFEDYVLNDLSLSEIADYQAISRQGVYDIIKRTSNLLEDYETKLRLMEKYSIIKSQIIEADNLLDNISEDKYNNVLIKEIFDKILNMI